MNRVFSLFTLMFALTLSGCGYNTIQTTDEQVKAAWAEVLNQYQRRADLIPNIVATVKGEAAFEQETLTKVIEARAKATSIQATPGGNWEVVTMSVLHSLLHRRAGRPSASHRRCRRTSQSAACWPMA